MEEQKLSQLIGPDLKAGVRAIMVSTLSGSTTMEGTSGQMGNATDHQLLLGLREWADAVFVGAHTVTAEDYGGVHRSESNPRPAPIVVPSQSLRINTGTRFFTECYTPPIFLVPHADLEREDVRARAEAIQAAGAKVIDAGPGTISDYLRVMREEGFSKIACEGGPGIIGQLVAADAIDEFYLTLDPHLSSGVSKALAYHPDAPVHRRMRVENFHLDPDGTVFLRYRRLRGQ